MSSTFSLVKLVGFLRWEAIGWLVGRSRKQAHQVREGARGRRARQMGFVVLSQKETNGKKSLPYIQRKSRPICCLSEHQNLAYSVIKYPHSRLKLNSFCQQLPKFFVSDKPGWNDDRVRSAKEMQLRTCDRVGFLLRNSFFFPPSFSLLCNVC